MGSRSQKGADGGGSFANRFSNFWFRLYTGVPLPDTQTGYRLYPLKRLPTLKLLSARYEAELTLLVFSAWKGIKLKPVPVQVVVANRFKTVGKKGITSLTCSFDGQDVTSVNEIVLQPHDSANIIVKDVYLNPGNALWESKVIWRKGCNFGNWENGFVIKPEFFATAYEGDKIEFIFNADTSNPDITYWLLKTVYNTTPNTLEGNDSELNDYGCASVSSHATAYRILLTANDVENLQHYGLFTNGFSVYVKQVNLLRRVYSEE